MALSLTLDYLLSPAFAWGAVMTLVITVLSLVFGILAGFVLALVQQRRSWASRAISTAYLWVFRGTPVLFQIIFIYNVLPGFGIRLSAFASAVLALSLNEAAYMAEILRAGLDAVRAGQRTAGLALGMTRAQVLRFVVLPQAARVVLPPVGNQMVGMLKTSALVSVVAVEELLLVANQTASASFHYLEALSAAGIYYMLLTGLFMGVQMLLERAADPKRRRRDPVEGLAALDGPR